MIQERTLWLWAVGNQGVGCVTPRGYNSLTIPPEQNAAQCKGKLFGTTAVITKPSLFLLS